MLKVAESTPNERILEALEKLSEIGFNPVFLSSTKYNMQQMRNNPATIKDVELSSRKCPGAAESTENA